MESEVYRNMYEKDKNNPEIESGELDRKAQIFELLGQTLDIDRKTPLYIMDTGALNDQIKAYAAIGCINAGMDIETAGKVISGICRALDEYNAGEITAVWERQTE